jgi:NitT/TauT family transport system substrate-binding protein
LALLALLPLSACKTSPSEITRLRVGYFANVTHAAALIANARGAWKKLPVPVEPKVFGAGPEEMEALNAGALDAAFVGPMPALTSFLRSHGESLVIVAGAAANGAAFVVGKDSGITGPESLHGKRLAAPQLGNTQDVALRIYLEEHGLKTREQGGDVQVMPIANPDILTLMRTGKLDGAWVPEPWIARLVDEAGARVLVDERDLWPNRLFSTAVLVVTRRLLREKPALVRALVESHVETVAWAQAHPEDARKVVDDALFEVTHKRLPEHELEEALGRVVITTDPTPAAIEKSLANGRKLGYLPPGDASGLFELSFLHAATQHD